MELRVGDRFTDETGEWEIDAPTWTTGSGKVVQARLRKVGEPAVIEERVWGAHEMLAIQRAGNSAGNY